MTTESKPQLTPMLQQYTDIKRQYPDALLFYRMGDFYELFYQDALDAAPLLEVQLTSRDKSADNPIPMCGIPHHALTQYLQKILAKGHKVALCEQLEDPSTAKGLVKREVVRVITPALVGDPDLVSDRTSNLLVGLHPVQTHFELASLDLLKGEVKAGIAESASQVLDFLSQHRPKEILLERELSDRELQGIRQLYPQILITYRGNYFVPFNNSPAVVGALKSYLTETQKQPNLDYFTSPKPLFEAQFVKMDGTSLRALEILESRSAHSDNACLLGVMDETQTPMGRRLLKEWLSQPSCVRSEIEARHDAVDALCSSLTFFEGLAGMLKGMRDLERLTSKTALGLAMPRDLVAMREALKRIPDLKTLLAKSSSKLFKRYARDLDPIPELTHELERALADEAPHNYREGGIFRPGFCAPVDEYRELSTNAKNVLAALETREKEKSGISSLKLKYSRVFGYTIEVTNSQLSKVPAHFIRKQTIANGERFITEELKQLEDQIISADGKLKKLEESLFLELRDKVSQHAKTLLQNAQYIAETDVLTNFARVSRQRNYTRPVMGKDWDFKIEEGRHPVLENLLPAGAFVPNSVHFTDPECRTLLITGPNMAGKSTIMRQVALIAILAHCGCFVPAKSAEIPVLDAIFTRIGSSDDLAQGQSTFMVEMTEVARILAQATPQSLIVIDEIGRGTSTYDGLSLAWSLLEHIHKELRAKTLFATHFHEVTSLERLLPGIQNVNVLVKRWNDQIVFLHKLGKGVCSQSYGVEVAKLAGLPGSVLERAKQILGVLESQSQKTHQTRSRALLLDEKQLGFFDELVQFENNPNQLSS